LRTKPGPDINGHTEQFLQIRYQFSEVEQREPGRRIYPEIEVAFLGVFATHDRPKHARITRAGCIEYAKHFDAM
jgi:hypothetical protein